MEDFMFYSDTFSVEGFSGIRSFQELREGDAFHMYDVDIARTLHFVKTWVGYDEFGIEINAVCLENGMLVQVENDTLVATSL